MIAVSGERRSCEIAWRSAVLATSARRAASASADCGSRPARARARRRSAARAASASRSRSASVPAGVAAARRASPAGCAGRRHGELALALAAGADALEPRREPPPAASTLVPDARRAAASRSRPASSRRRGLGEDRRLALARRGQRGSPLGLGGPLAREPRARRPTTSAAIRNTTSATTLSRVGDRQPVARLDEEEVERQRR